MEIQQSSSSRAGPNTAGGGGRKRFGYTLSRQRGDKLEPGTLLRTWKNPQTLPPRVTTASIQGEGGSRVGI